MSPEVSRNAGSPEKRVLQRTTRVIPFSYGKNGEVYVYLQKKKNDTRNPEKSGAWEPPGGKADSEWKENETRQEYLRRNAMRELSEEMGIQEQDPALLKFLGYKETPLHEEGAVMKTAYYLCPVDRGREAIITQNNDELEKGEWILLSDLPHFLVADDDTEECSKRKLNVHSFPPEFFSENGEIRSEEEIQKIGKTMFQRIYSALHSRETRESANAVFQQFTLKNYIAGKVDEGTHSPDGELVTIADVISQYKDLSSEEKRKFVEKIFFHPYKKGNEDFDLKKLSADMEHFLTDKAFTEGFREFFEKTEINISESRKNEFLGLKRWKEYSCPLRLKNISKFLKEFRARLASFPLLEDSISKRGKKDILRFCEAEPERNEIGFLLVLLLSGYELWKTGNFQEIEKKTESFRSFLQRWKDQEDFQVILPSEEIETVSIVPEHSTAKTKTIYASLEKMMRKAEFLGEVSDVLQGRLVIRKKEDEVGETSDEILFEFAKSRYQEMQRDEKRFSEIRIECEEGNPSSGQRREVKILGRMRRDHESSDARGVPFEIQIMTVEDLNTNEEEENHHKIYEIVRGEEMKSRFPWLFEGITPEKIKERIIRAIVGGTPKKNTREYQRIIRESLARVMKNMFPEHSRKNFRDRRAVVRKRSFSHMQGGDFFGAMMEQIGERVFGKEEERWKMEDLQLLLDNPLVFFRKEWRRRVNEILSKEFSHSEKREKIEEAREGFEQWREEMVSNVSRVFVMQIAGCPRAIHGRLQEHPETKGKYEEIKADYDAFLEIKRDLGNTESLSELSQKEEEERFERRKELIRLLQALEQKYPELKKQENDPPPSRKES